MNNMYRLGIYGLIGFGLNVVLLTTVSARQSNSNTNNGPDVQDPKLACSITVPEPEPANLSSLAKIKGADAKTKALSGQPVGTKVTAMSLDNENGCLTYGVELSNKLEVAVAAGNGAVLRVEPIDSGERNSETADNGHEN